MRARLGVYGICVVSLLAPLLAPRTVQAGEAPLMVRIAPRPKDSDRIVLAYLHSGDGLLYSRDRGQTFSALCTTAISEVEASGQFVFINNLEDSVITADGHVLAGDIKGLWIDDGELCNWSRIPALKNEWVTSIALDPRDANVVYGVLASSSGEANGLFRRNADGSVERLGKGSADKLHSLEIAARGEGELRFYATAIVGYTPIFYYDAAPIPLPDGGSATPQRQKANHVLRYSDDEGASWTEYAIETELGHAVHVEAIDPTDVDRVVLWLQHGEELNPELNDVDTLVVAEQGGALQTHWLELQELGGVVIEPDGTAWIAGHGKDGERGVWRAERVGGELTKLRDEQASCIALHDGEIELCDRFDYGVADKATAKLLDRPWLFKTIDRVHTCEGVDLVSLCRMDFCKGGFCAGDHAYDSPMCSVTYGSVMTYGCDGAGMVVPRDAGTTATDAAVAMTPKASGCSCGVLGVRRGAGALGWLLALVLLRWRSSRRS